MKNNNLVQTTAVSHSSVISSLQSCLNFHFNILPCKHPPSPILCALGQPWLSVRPPHSSYCAMWIGRVKWLTVDNVRRAFTSRSKICTVCALLPDRYFRLRLAAQPAAHPSGRLCCGSNCRCLQERGWQLQRGC